MSHRFATKTQGTNVKSIKQAGSAGASVMLSKLDDDLLAGAKRNTNTGDGDDDDPATADKLGEGASAAHNWTQERLTARLKREDAAYSAYVISDTLLDPRYL
jgi:hypothetical protein